MENIKTKQKLTINGLTEEEEEEILRRVEEFESGDMTNFIGPFSDIKELIKSLNS